MDVSTAYYLDCDSSFVHISIPSDYESLRHSPTALGYPTNIPSPTKFNTLIIHYVSNSIHFYNSGVGGMRRQPLNPPTPSLDGGARRVE